MPVNKLLVPVLTHAAWGLGAWLAREWNHRATSNTTSDKMWAKTTIYNSERGKLKHKTRVRARLFNKPNCGACGLKEGLLGIRSTSGSSEIWNVQWAFACSVRIESLETWWKMYIAIYFNSTKKMNISCIQKTCWVFFQADFTSIKFT